MIGNSLKVDVWRTMTRALIGATLAAVFLPPLANAQPGDAASEADFYAVLLGTGIPLPNPDRGTASTLIVAGERRILIDTGRRCMTNLDQAGFHDATLVLFTHFHSDHVAGFGEYLVNRGVAGVEEPQRVIGPPGTRSLVDRYLAAYADDTQYRKDHHGEHWPPNAMTPDVTEVEPGVVYDEDGLRITMFEVSHPPIVPAVGYRIDYAGKSIVVSGDTVKVPQMVEMARGVDVLIHEAMNVAMLQAARNMARGNARQVALIVDVMDYHTSTLDVAEIARDAEVGQLVLTHLLPSIPPTDGAEAVFTRGMADIYSGPIVVGRDGMKITP